MDERQAEAMAVLRHWQIATTPNVRSECYSKAKAVITGQESVEETIQVIRKRHPKANIRSSPSESASREYLLNLEKYEGGKNCCEIKYSGWQDWVPEQAAMQIAGSEDGIIGKVDLVLIDPFETYESQPTTTADPSCADLWTS